MKNRYVEAFIHSALSIVPMIVIVLILSFLPSAGNMGVKVVALGGFDYLALGIGTIIMILGSGLFDIGANQGLSKVGEYMGSSLSKQEKIFIVVAFSFLLGALITCAEPSILIIASQVGMNSLLLIGVIAGGVGLFVVIGVLRIIFHGSLKIWYLFFYLIVFGLVCLICVDKNAQNFLPFIFDAGGITTGSATVPFILALGAGIAVVRGGKHSTEDSFGLVGMASIGPILSMIILLMINSSGFTAYTVSTFNGYSDFGAIIGSLGEALIPQSATHLGTILEVTISILPIILIFLLYNAIFMKLPKKVLKTLMIGFVYTFFGLIIFLTGVNSVMANFGSLVGRSVGSNLNNDWAIILLCFIFGLVSVLCEPAVHVLTSQIVSVSNGSVKKSTVLFSLCIGVGVAIALAVMRTLFDFSILYIIVPGYLLSLGLMFLSPNIYTAMAFDAGGTASGPMSVSFILPMVIGITYARTDFGPSSVNYYSRSFGVVALIALTPIITIQILGVIQNAKQAYHLRVLKGLIKDPSDSQIIHFK